MLNLDRECLFVIRDETKWGLFLFPFFTFAAATLPSSVENCSLLIFPHRKYKDDELLHQKKNK